MKYACTISSEVNSLQSDRISIKVDINKIVEDNRKSKEEVVRLRVTRNSGRRRVPWNNSTL